MSKTLVLTAAGLCILLGSGLVAHAYAAEFRHAVVADDAWNGPNAPAVARGPMLLGILLLATGLAAVVVPLGGWLSAESGGPTTITRDAFAPLGLANTLAGRMPTRATLPRTLR
jgi:hypothetical protein